MRVRSVRPDVIVHIGPPKTGTTSLQVALEGLEHPNLLYAGAFQPRTRNTGSLCHMLYGACSGKQIDTSGLQAELDRIMKQRKTIFFSDEKFLLEQPEVSIEEKIRNLRRALSGLNCRILITARSGKTALPSLYQELFHSLPMKLQTNFSAFCKDKRAWCYDYFAVCEMLVASGFEDIVVFDFEDLKKPNLHLGVLTACDEFLDYSFSLKQHNSGLYGSTRNERGLAKVSLKNFGRSVLVKSIINAMNMRKWPGYRNFVSVLDRAVIVPSGIRTLKVPSDVAYGLEVSFERALSSFGQHTQKNSVD